MTALGQDDQIAMSNHIKRVRCPQDSGKEEKQGAQHSRRHCQGLEVDPMPPILRGMLVKFMAWATLSLVSSIYNNLPSS